MYLKNILLDSSSSSDEELISEPVKSIVGNLAEQVVLIIYVWRKGRVSVDCNNKFGVPK